MKETRDHFSSVDKKLVLECAGAFAKATNLPCTVSTVEGQVFGEFGIGFSRCGLCGIAGCNVAKCTKVHTYGLHQAERFGGRYIYFCPSGLTFFTSPILGSKGSEAKITVGPFLMVPQEDFVEFELKKRMGLSKEALAYATEQAAGFQYASPEKVESYSILLFMSLGFINNIWEASHLLETENSQKLQGKISDYIFQLKSKENEREYPFSTEKKLLQSIRDYDRDNAARYLNELLGFILFSSGGDIAHIKTRVNELLVLISRASVEAGTPPEYALRENHRYLQEIQSIKTMDGLCNWLTNVMHKYMDTTFSFSDVKHVDVIHKSVQYVHQNFFEKITLESVAKRVHLSPSYFSKVFKKEMGCNFSTYLNNERIDKSKKLLLEDEYTLLEIAVMVGFEDHSYFTKVFTKVTGVSPSHYRKTKGRLANNK